MSSAARDFSGKVVAMQSGGKGITHEVVDLTPAMAEELLKRNTHNRSLSDREVLKWATEMEQGRWRYNGEAIKISDDGTILDGQHRLTALTLCIGVTIKVLIVSGLPADTQMTMDQGKKRKASDQLCLNGFRVDNSSAAALKQFILWDENLFHARTATQEARTTAPKIVAWVEANHDMAQLITDAHKFRGIPIKASVMQAAYGIIVCSTEQTIDVVDEFFGRCADGVGLELNSPILTLRNRLVKIRSERLHITERDLIGLFIQAWNHWRKGKPLQKLQRPAGGWTADTYPKVWPR
jgi:hypothetical protein